MTAHVEQRVKGLDASASEPEQVETIGALEQSGGIMLRLGGARYALEMGSVAEVVPLPAVTRVPNVPIWLAGVANWRGHVLPVVDLRPVVGAEIIPLASSARLVVVSADGVEVGVIAEGVPGLLSDEARALVPAPATVPAVVSGLVKGVVDDSGPVSVLDPDAILALRRELPTARRSA